MPSENPNERTQRRGLYGAALVAAAILVPLLVVAWIAVRRDRVADVRPAVGADALSAPLGSAASASPSRPSPDARSVGEPATVTEPKDAQSGTPELAELRRLGLTNPERSLELTQSWSTRVSAEAAPAEVMWFETRALVELGRFDEARAVAHAMLQRHPNEPWTADVRRHLLSHPLGLPPREH